MALLEFLPEIVPLSVFALIGIVSLYVYFKLRKTGFMLIGIGFLVYTVAPLIRLALGGPYLPLRLFESGLTQAEIGLFEFSVALVDWSLLIAFAILVLVGLFLLMKGIPAKQAS